MIGQTPILGIFRTVVFPSRNGAAGVLLFVVSTFHCSAITDPFYEAEYRDSGSKIRRSDALAMIAPAAYNYIARCRPEGGGAGSTAFMDIIMREAPCTQPLMPGDSECPDHEFLDRDSVTICRLVIDLATCKDASINMVCVPVFTD
jgi:hypothetical protein